MVNRLYNKQVSPKGFMKGGRVKKMGGGMMKKDMMDKPMMKKGGNVKPRMMKKGGSIKKFAPGGKVTKGAATKKTVKKPTMTLAQLRAEAKKRKMKLVKA